LLVERVGFAISCDPFQSDALPTSARLSFDMSTTQSPGTTPNLLPAITGLQAREDRRRLAVQRVLDGHSQVEVARFLNVSTRSLAYWMKWYRDQGEDGLKLRPIPGATPKLSDDQERQVLQWLTQDATTFGFATNLWSSRRVTHLIQEQFGIDYNANYFCRWLKARNITPQMPKTVAAQRDEQKIADYAEKVFTPLKKKP
jgi:transposase